MFQFLVWCWAGLLLGVSFIATPAKFLAPSINLQQALEVGKVTFGVFKWVECGLVLMLLVALFVLPLARLARLLGIVLIAVIVIQYVVLLPMLDARVILILQGESVQRSHLHFYYVAIELIKIALLIGAGFCNQTRAKAWLEPGAHK